MEGTAKRKRDPRYHVWKFDDHTETAKLLTGGEGEHGPLSTTSRTEAMRQADIKHNRGQGGCYMVIPVEEVWIRERTFRTERSEAISEYVPPHLRARGVEAASSPGSGDPVGVTT